MAADSNIVGYYNQDGGGYRVSIPSFVGVNFANIADTKLVDVIETADLSPYSDEVQVYDSVAGTYTTYLWDGAEWTDGLNTNDILIEPGKGYVFSTVNDVIFKGQVIDTPTYQHEVPEGYSMFGSAFPVPLKASKFNFAAVLQAFSDEIQVYDAVAGVWDSWMWDGTRFTDGANTLPDELASIGQGILFGNLGSGTTITITETL